MIKIEDQNSKVLLAYHSEDNDGTFSAAIIYKYLTEIQNIQKSQIVLYPTTYSELAKADTEVYNDIANYWNTKYDVIIMTDISFNNALIMKDLFIIFGDNFYWYDHHKPIIEASKKLEFDTANGLRGSDCSALMLVYRDLYDNNIPELLKILSGWDSWTYDKEGYTLQHVMDVNKAISMMTGIEFEKALEIVNEIMDKNGCKTQKDHSKVVYAQMYGSVISEYDKFQYKVLMKSAEFGWSVHGRPAAAIFMQGPSNSLMFDSIKDKVQIGIVFKKVSGENKWNTSIYNTQHKFDNDFDCGAYLKLYYNGGGHKGAAGAILSQDQFDNLLITKSL